jgi:ferredoxin/flavodoxin
MSARVPEPSWPNVSVGIFYFSGVGGTRVVAEILGSRLSGLIPCEVRSIEEKDAAEAIAKVDVIVLCYPTYFLKPAPAMADFVRSIPKETKGREVFLITTYELYTGNSNRRLALPLRARGFAMAGAYELRAPGTDVTCVVPDRFCGWLYRFERRFPEKIAEIARKIAGSVAGYAAESAAGQAKAKGSAGGIPWPKWYSPLAWPLQVLFLDSFIRWKDRMKVLEERCSGCDLCVRDCHRGAWRRVGGKLEHRGEACDLCLRCVHHCPGRAIVLKPRLKDNRRLDRTLYKALAREALKIYETDNAVASERGGE